MRRRAKGQTPDADASVKDTIQFLSQASADSAHQALVVAGVIRKLCKIASPDILWSGAPAVPSFGTERDKALAVCKLVARIVQGQDLDEAATAIAAEHLARGMPLPSFLTGHVVQVLRDELRQKPGPKSIAFLYRDYLIACAVKRMTSRGFRQSRNVASKTPSACSIVSEAAIKVGMPLTEDAIKKACDRFKASGSTVGIDVSF